MKSTSEKLSVKDLNFKVLSSLEQANILGGSADEADGKKKKKKKNKELS